MSINRIQKLLFSEYSDFEDMVLIESPFAQTTREGKGIRQVNLGLTPTKLVLAADVLPPMQESHVNYVPGIDPDIETFELVAVYPVECLNLSVFHRRKRQSLKAHFCNNRILYFELGGFEKRKMFWNLWCERVKFLNPEDPGSSRSETSVASSTSNSTLCLLASRNVVTEAGLRQLWCKFGYGDVGMTKWPNRYLYMGRQLNEPVTNYVPSMKAPTISEFVHRKNRNLDTACNCRMVQDNLFIYNPIRSRALLNLDTVLLTASQKLIDKLKGSAAAYLHRSGALTQRLHQRWKRGSKEQFTTIRRLASVNRFGSGIPEGCKSGLFLSTDNTLMQTKLSTSTIQSTENEYNFQTTEVVDYINLTESAVRAWELSNVHRRGRHRRRYGFAPQPHFLHGLGPWSVPPGEKFSVQVKRAVSAVRIQRQPIEAELRLSIAKRQLVSSISCEALHLDNRLLVNTSTVKTVHKKPVVFFWTPDYWYRPRSARDAYLQVLDHLKKVREFCQQQRRKRGGFGFKKGVCITNYLSLILKGGKRRFFHKKKRSLFLSDSTDSDEVRRTPRPKRCGIDVFNSLKNEGTEKGSRKKPEETSLQFLRRVLRISIALTAWDFDSTTLACQLTIIDRDLFLKITPIELGVLIWQQTSKNAPNIGAFEAFSHRITCLVATEVLRDDSDKIRARLISRLINAAEKCHKMSNFQSCRSILCGLQSPAIYRLHKTWTYVRKRHATKYQVFEVLCRLYRDPRLPTYRKEFFRATQTSPYLPYLGDLILKLLEQQHKDSDGVFPQSCSSMSTLQISKETVNSSKSIGPLKRLLSTLRKFPLDTAEISRVTSTTISFDFSDDRIVRLNRAVKFLEKCQTAATAYSLKGNELAGEYLLKARYREERENFFNSFSIERPDFVHRYT